MTTKADQLTAVVTEHGEGPVWDVDLDALRLVDMLRGDVLTLRGGVVVERQNFGAIAAVWRPRLGGGSVVAVEQGFCLVTADGERELLPPVLHDPSVRMNEGGCDPQGRFYCGSMGYESTPGAGSLFRLDPDRSVRRVLPEVTISNGLAWSPDGARVFYVDTPTGRIDVFDFEPSDGSVSGRRPFAVIEESDGMPDGITVDTEGGVWVALFGGGEVRRYGPSGSLDEIVSVPTPQPTACTFGGEDVQRLFITTSSDGLQHPDEFAGAVFTCSPGARGLPVLPFHG